MGSARRTRVHYDLPPGQREGNTAPVYVARQHVGDVVRTSERVKPVFVSPGHLISVGAATQVVLDLPGNYRIPDPLRFADRAAREHCFGEAPSQGWIDLGEVAPSTHRWVEAATRLAG